MVSMRIPYFMRYYSTFLWAIPLLWAGYSRVTRPSATVHLLIHPEGIIKRLLVRLACVRHAASVRPEPGSNSRYIVILKPKLPYTYLCLLAHFTNSDLFFVSELNCHKKLKFFDKFALFVFQCTTLSH